MSQPAPDHTTANLPLFDWAEERYIMTAQGQRLDREGSVKKACAVLGCTRQQIYDLISAGLVDAWKVKPHRPNSHWKLDMLSVWRFKKNQYRSKESSAK